MRKGRPVRPQGWTGLARTSAHEASQAPGAPIRREPSRIMHTTGPLLPCTHHQTPPPSLRTPAIINITCLGLWSSLSVTSLHHLLPACPPTLAAAHCHYAYNSLFLSPRHTQLLYASLRHPLSQDTNCAPRGLGRPRDRTRAHLHEMSSGLSRCSFESTTPTRPTTPKLSLRLS